jgi:hypothetical protein
VLSLDPVASPDPKLSFKTCRWNITKVWCNCGEEALDFLSEMESLSFNGRENCELLLEDGRVHIPPDMAA